MNEAGPPVSNGVPMPRLIEVQPAGDGWPSIRARVGDVLVIRASGGRVHDGESAVEMWGPFQSAVVGDTGEVLVPAGPPNAVLVRARQPGAATLALFFGDQWRDPRQGSMVLAVES